MCACVYLYRVSRDACVHARHVDGSLVSVFNSELEQARFSMQFTVSTAKLNVASPPTTYFDEVLNSKGGSLNNVTFGKILDRADAPLDGLLENYPVFLSLAFSRSLSLFGNTLLEMW